VPNAHPELYDVIADPHEEHDLAGAHPNRLTHLQSLIDAWWPAR